MYPDSVTLATQEFLDMRSNTQNGSFQIPTLYLTSSGVIKYFANGVDRITSATSTMTAAAWQFFAYSKQSGSGGTGELSINGTVVGSWSDTMNYIACGLYVGCANSGASSVSLGGRMDEIRITKGAARYSGNFTAPTMQFPDR